MVLTFPAPPRNIVQLAGTVHGGADTHLSGAMPGSSHQSRTYVRLQKKNEEKAKLY